VEPVGTRRRTAVGMHGRRAHVTCGRQYWCSDVAAQCAPRALARIAAEPGRYADTGSGTEDVFRQERRDQEARDVDQLTDLEIDSDAADRIRLLTAPAPLAEVVDHVE
jgi:hypothetical protein